MACPHPWLIISRLLGAVLLGAGALKGYEFAADLTAGMVPSEPSWLAVAAGGEVLLGCWLFVGLYPSVSWFLAAGTFLALLGVSFDKASAGETSCGCFGRFSVSPWYTFAFDVAALLALICAQPFGAPRLFRGGRGRWAAFIGLSVFALVGVALVPRLTQATRLDDGDWSEDGSDARLGPEAWVGRRLPLMKHIDIGPQLQQGRWALMFYRPDCTHCRVLIPQFMGLAFQLASQTATVRTALIEVPGRDSPASRPPVRGTVCLRGRLMSEPKPRIQTLLFVLLTDGVVTRTTDSLDAVIQELVGPSDKSAVGTGGFLFPDYRRIRREMFLREVSCGPLALIRLFQEFGTSPSPEEAEQLLAEAGDKGIDMYRLKELAEARGLSALGATTTTEGLRRMGQEAIAYLNNIGFVAVIGYRPEGVEVVYPLQAAGILPDDLFAKSFGEEGRALLVSDKPLRPEQLGLSSPPEDGPRTGPRLRLSRSVLAVGRLHRRNWETKIVLTNVGTETLVISDVKASCPCFKAWVEQPTLGPGETTVLRARGTQSDLGGFTYRALLATNETGKPETLVLVRGYVEHPVGFGLPTVFLSDLRPGQAAQTEVELDLPRGLDPSRLRLKIPDKGLFTPEMRTALRVVFGVRISEPEPVPLTVELRTGSPRPAVVLHWAGVVRPGWYRYEVEVSAGSFPDAIRSVLPCTVEVVPQVEAFPPSLLVPTGGSGSSWARRVTVTAKHPISERIALRWSDSQVAAHVQAKITRTNDRSLVIELTGRSLVGGRNLTFTVLDGATELVSVPILCSPNGS